ncbi:hypothetical protein Bca101_059629 [Brassica carinata]
MFGGVGENCSDLESEQLMKSLPKIRKMLKSEAENREDVTKRCGWCFFWSQTSLTHAHNVLSVEGQEGYIVRSKRSKHDEAGSSKNSIQKCDGKCINKDDAKPPDPPKDYIHARARRGQPIDSHSLAERRKDQRDNDFTSGSGFWLQMDNRESSYA